MGELGEVDRVAADYVLSGRVSLHTQAATRGTAPGDLLIVPDSMHNLEALEDSMVLLTVAKIA